MPPPPRAVREVPFTRLKHSEEIPLSGYPPAAFTNLPRVPVGEHGVWTEPYERDLVSRRHIPIIAAFALERLDNWQATSIIR